MPSQQKPLPEETSYRVMQLLQENPNSTQRELAEKLEVSVGGVNYCLKALVDKGWVKMKNFAYSKNKFGYVYVLTTHALFEKADLTARFLKRKMAEYEMLRVEIETLKTQLATQEIPEKIKV